MMKWVFEGVYVSVLLVWSSLGNINWGMLEVLGSITVAVLGYILVQQREQKREIKGYILDLKDDLVEDIKEIKIEVKELENRVRENEGKDIDQQKDIDAIKKTLQEEFGL